MTIHYEHVGTIAWCEAYRDTLGDVMESALAGNEADALVVVNCGAHFYGLLRDDFESFEDFTQAIHDADYAMESK